MMHHTELPEPWLSRYRWPLQCTDSWQTGPYEKDVIELRSQWLTYPQIHKILCRKGYTGSVAFLRMFMQKERSKMREQGEQDKPQSEFIQRKSLCQLVYKKLDAWIESAQKHDIPE